MVQSNACLPLGGVGVHQEVRGLDSANSLCSSEVHESRGEVPVSSKKKLGFPGENVCCLRDRAVFLGVSLELQGKACVLQGDPWVSWGNPWHVLNNVGVRRGHSLLPQGVPSVSSKMLGLSRRMLLFPWEMPALHREML